MTLRAAAEQLREQLATTYPREEVDLDAVRVLVDAALAEQPQPEAQPELGYATRLATSMWEKHYKAAAPDWQPCDSLMGVLTQIDNMSSGLASPTSAPFNAVEVAGAIGRLVEERPELRETFIAAMNADSFFKQPGWDHVFAAYVAGAREARANPDADETVFGRAADAYTKLIFSEVDPETHRRIGENDWPPPSTPDEVAPAPEAKDDALGAPAEPYPNAGRHPCGRTYCMRDDCHDLGCQNPNGEKR